MTPKRLNQLALFSFPVGIIGIIAISIVILDFCSFFDAIPVQYQNLFFAGLVSIVSLLTLPLLQKRPFLSYLLVCIPYVMVISKFLFSLTLPVHDSWVYHFPIFEYIGNAFTKGCFFPEWIPVSGGVRMGFFHINLFPTIPHRLLGYCLYSLLPISIVLGYKLQYVLGVILMSLGWWLVLQKLTRSQYATYFGTLMIMMGGTGITFHQEQVLATTYLIPWFVLSLLKIREDTSYIFPAVILFGLGLTTHNPQIQLISMGLLLILMILFRPSLMKNIYQKQKRFILLLLILFVLVILPSLYILHNLDNLASPVRATEEFHPQTYEDYLRLSEGGVWSALPSYYNQYIRPSFNAREGVPMDRCSFFVGRIALVLIFIGVFFNLRKTFLSVLLLIIFAGLTLGINSPIPIAKYLYYIRFPFIDVFREWFHFFPMLNFCLSVLAAIGLAIFLHFSRQKSRIFFVTIIISVLFFQILDLVLYDRNYIAFFHRADKPTKIIDNFSLRENLNPANIFQYKNRYRLFKSCPQAIPNEPFFTTEVLSVIGGVDKELEKVCEIALKGEGLVVTNIPSSMLQAFFTGKRISGSKVVGSVSFKGLYFDINVPENVLFVIPLNYDLGTRAYVDGRKVKLWRINSALSGILVEKGDHWIEFKIKHDVYILIVFAQLLLYIFLVLFFVYRYKKESKTYSSRSIEE